MFALILCACWATGVLLDRVEDPDLSHHQVLFSLQSICNSSSELQSGDWFANRTTFYEQELCCGWDQANNYKTTAGCSLGPLNEKVQWTVGGHGCDCKGSEHLLEYRPSTCKMIDWDVKKFCFLLEDHYTVFVGDSVMQQVYGTLIAMIHAVDPYCATTITFYLSDTLDGNDYGGRQRGKTLKAIVEETSLWSEAIELDLFFVVSFGTHVNTASSENATLWFNEVVDYALGTLKDIPFMWLTQAPAHPGCLNGTEPDWSKDVYNWKHFIDFEQAVVQKLGERRVVNTFNPLMKRMDAHARGECMHWCIGRGGALEVVPLFLHHLLTVDPTLLLSD